MIVIVGAGPTGVMLAIELARRGVDVRVLDKLASPPRESRAIGIHARSLEIFRQLGMSDEFLDLGHRVDGFVVHTNGRRAIEGRFGKLDSPYRFLLTLSQDETQRILDQRLESLGVTVERSVIVTGARHEPDRVELHMQQGSDSRERTLAADWVVGCDGAHSVVRRSLGVAFEGEDYGQDWLMAEVKIDAPLLRRDRFHVFARTAQPLPLFPLPADRWRVFVPQVPNRAAPERAAPAMEEIERLAEARGPSGIRLSDPTLLAAFRCYRRSSRTMRQGRAFVAGDAAHIHSPAGGQGMNTGLQDAFNLGWKLALVDQRRAPASLLDSYEAERAPIATGVLALTHALVRTFALRSRSKRWVRDRALPVAMAIPGVERRYAERLAQLSHSYRHPRLAIAVRQSKLSVGDRLPVVCGLRRGGEEISTLDLLAFPGHTLLVLCGERVDEPAASRVVASLSHYALEVQIALIGGSAGSADPHAIEDPGLRAHRRYDALGGRLLLVRPDGYLAASAVLRRPALLERYLSAVIQHRATHCRYCQ